LGRFTRNLEAVTDTTRERFFSGNFAKVLPAAAGALAVRYQEAASDAIGEPGGVEPSEP
jgi:hypothetical protein